MHEFTKESVKRSSRNEAAKKQEAKPVEVEQHVDVQQESAQAGENKASEHDDSKKFSFIQACSLNTMNMFGTGPFITVPYCLAEMDPVGPQCMIGYAIACFACMCDSFVWGELAGIWPINGGSYTYLKKTYGEKTWGKFMGFMFIWQFFVSGPAELASGYIAISEYLLYIFDTDDYWTRVGLSLATCLVTSAILFRTKDTIGSVALFLWGVTGFAMIFCFITGFANFDGDYLKSPSDAFSDKGKLLLGIAATTRFGVYDMTGYYDVCSFGDEVVKPRRTVPLSCVITCMVVACIYIMVYITVIGSMDYNDYIHMYEDDYDGEAYGIMSIFTEKHVSKNFAYFITLVVCVTIFGSNFAQLCGYAYLPYAAAHDGLFFEFFKEKTAHGLPHYSLLTVCIISALWCFFSLDIVIDAMTTLLVIVQFIGQSVGLVYYKMYNEENLPEDRWKMPLYPLPVIIQMIIFFVIFITTDSWIISGGDPVLEGSIIVLWVGVVLFLVMQRARGDWPFNEDESKEEEEEEEKTQKGEAEFWVASTVTNNADTSGKRIPDKTSLIME